VWIVGYLAAYLIIMSQQQDSSPAWWYIALLVVAAAMLTLVAAGQLGRPGLVSATGLLGFATVIALLSVLRMVMTFNKFDDVYLLTGGTAGTQVAAVRVIDTLNSNFDIGAAAAEALALSAVLTIFLVIYVRYVNRYGVQAS
jgi:hypothetical protein